MLVAFALVGCLLIWEGVRSWVVTLRRRPHLRKTQGTVITVEKKRETRTSGSPPRMRTYVKFHPVINFTTPDGKIQSFTSEMGESYVVQKRSDGTHTEPVSKYSPGQRLDILYDPEGKLPPCLNSWSGLFGPVAALIAAGLVFCGGSALIWFAFKDKLTGP